MTTNFLPRAVALLAACLWLSGCGLFSSSDAGFEPPPNVSGVARTACSQMGKKYCPGGASPQKGFDCSGLVWWSYRQHGVNVPRITTDQARAGKKISRKQIKAGDIMVFRVNRSPRGLHTGLYAGDNQFIHSPSSGKRVRIDSLDPYWRDKLIAIRRVGKAGD